MSQGTTTEVRQDRSSLSRYLIDLSVPYEGIIGNDNFRTFNRVVDLL